MCAVQKVRYFLGVRGSEWGSPQGVEPARRFASTGKQGGFGIQNVAEKPKKCQRDDA
jgi:hypothetical protein